MTDDLGDGTTINFTMYKNSQIALYSGQNGVIFTVRSYLSCFLFLMEFRVDDKSRRRKEIKDDSSQFHLFYILYFSEKKKNIDVPVLLYSLYTGTLGNG